MESLSIFSPGDVGVCVRVCVWKEMNAEEFLFGIPPLSSRPAAQICISVTSDDVKGIRTHLLPPPLSQLSRHCSAILTPVALHPSHI